MELKQLRSAAENLLHSQCGGRMTGMLGRIPLFHRGENGHGCMVLDPFLELVRLPSVMNNNVPRLPA